MCRQVRIGYLFGGGPSLRFENVIWKCRYDYPCVHTPTFLSLCFAWADIITSFYQGSSTACIISLNAASGLLRSAKSVRSLHFPNA